MIREFLCDLHIHTCLSPCGDLDMYPRALVTEAVRRHIDCIAICDHNASENVIPVMTAAEGKPLSVLPGMEIATREEIHVIALFDNTDSLADIQKTVYASLHGTNEESLFGCQAIVDHHDAVVGINEHLLIGATTLSLADVVDTIHDRRGLAIAAHIDRECFSVISQIGFIPPNVHFDALEISRHMSTAQARLRFDGIDRFPLIRSSDAHYIGDIGQATTIMALEAVTTQEIEKALLNTDGRYIRCDT